MMKSATSLDEGGDAITPNTSTPQPPKGSASTSPGTTNLPTPPKKEGNSTNPRRHHQNGTSGGTTPSEQSFNGTSGKITNSSSSSYKIENDPLIDALEEKLRARKKEERDAEKRRKATQEALERQKEEERAAKEKEKLREHAIRQEEHAKRLEQIQATEQLRPQRLEGKFNVDMDVMTGKKTIMELHKEREKKQEEESLREREEILAARHEQFRRDKYFTALLEEHERGERSPNSNKSLSPSSQQHSVATPPIRSYSNSPSTRSPATGNLAPGPTLSPRLPQAKKPPHHLNRLSNATDGTGGSSSSSNPTVSNDDTKRGGKPTIVRKKKATASATVAVHDDGDDSTIKNAAHRDNEHSPSGKPTAGPNATSKKPTAIELPPGGAESRKLMSTNASKASRVLKKKLKEEQPAKKGHPQQKQQQKNGQATVEGRTEGETNGAIEEDEEEDEQEDGVVAMFSEYDKNGNGRLERKELPKLLADLREKLGSDFTGKNGYELFKELDRDGDGTVDIEEFRALFVSSGNFEPSSPNSDWWADPESPTSPAQSAVPASSEPLAGIASNESSNNTSIGSNGTTSLSSNTKKRLEVPTDLDPREMTVEEREELVRRAKEKKKEQFAAHQKEREQRLKEAKIKVDPDVMAGKKTILEVHKEREKKIEEEQAREREEKLAVRKAEHKMDKEFYESIAKHEKEEKAMQEAMQREREEALAKAKETAKSVEVSATMKKLKEREQQEKAEKAAKDNEAYDSLYSRQAYAAEVKEHHLPTNLVAFVPPEEKKTEARAAMTRDEEIRTGNMNMSMSLGGTSGTSTPARRHVDDDLSPHSAAKEAAKELAALPNDM